MITDIDGDPFALSAEDQIVIDAVLESYGSMTGDELAELTHSEDPWRDAFNGETGLASNIISLDSIFAYYSSLISGDSEVGRVGTMFRTSPSRRTWLSVRTISPGSLRFCRCRAWATHGFLGIRSLQLRI